MDTNTFSDLMVKNGTLDPLPPLPLPTQPPSPAVPSIPAPQSGTPPHQPTSPPGQQPHLAHSPAPWKHGPLFQYVMLGKLCRHGNRCSSLSPHTSRGRWVTLLGGDPPEDSLVSASLTSKGSASFLPDHLFKDVCVATGLRRYSVSLPRERTGLFSVQSDRQCLPREQRSARLAAHYKRFRFPRLRAPLP